ncbi:MAG: ABC transporter permease [Candidatus Pacearchaeota archaeon]|nr:ABC transporter permease [Candidatus Pacearchaeota archaeon]
MIEFFEEIYAVALRDIKKRSSFLKYIGMLSLSIAAILFIGYGFESFIDFSQYGESYTEFFYAGIIVYTLIISGLQISLELISDKNSFTRVLLVAPISRYSILFGKILSSFVSSMKNLFIMIIFFLAIFSQLDAIKILEIIIFMFFTIVSYNGVGLLLSSFFKNRDTATQIIGFVTFGLLFLSGILYPISAMPKYAKYFLYANPAAYTVDLFRYIMIGENFFPVKLSLIVSLIFGIIAIFFGTYIFDRNQRK